MAADQGEFIELVCPRCGAPLKGQGEQFTCQHCGARLLLRRSNQASGGKPRDVVVNGVTLVPFAYYDPQASLEAFSILIPKGWEVRGGVEWVPTRAAAPTNLALQLLSPDGVTAIEGFPTRYFTWTPNPMLMVTQPVGSLYFGNEVQQPVPARDAMRAFFLPRVRRFPDLSIVSETPAPDMLQLVMKNPPPPTQGAQYSNDSLRVRVQYTQNQQTVAEEFFGIAEYTRVGMPGMFGVMESVFWSLGYLSSYRSNAQHIDEYSDLYRAVVTSAKVNPAWAAFVQQISSGLVNNTIRGINQIGELSRQISRNNDQIREMNMRGWQERSAVYDRINERFDEHIRGVDPYFDPNTGSSVELPAGYTHAWSTALGEYIVSDDPNFNPNINSTQNWTPLEPQK